MTSGAVVEQLRSELRGQLLLPGDAGYDDARKVFNAMIDKHPSMIVRCAGAGDVMAAVRFSRENEIVVSVRGGGHSVSGKGVCDDALMIDLSPMRGIRVDPVERRVHAQPGCRLRDLDRETQAFGLATPTGIASDTGIVPPGRYHYWKSAFVRELSESAIDALVTQVSRKPSPTTFVGLQQMHGASARVPVAATAFPHRAEQYDLIILTNWVNPADADENIRWTRELWDVMQAIVDDSVYVNDLGDEGTDRVQAAYGSNYPRLAAIKKKWDPTNFFRLNQNIPPAGA